MDSTRIEDDNNQVINIEDIDNCKFINMFDDINREIIFQTTNNSNLHNEQQNNRWKYPIENNMFQDLNYHARTCMFVNMYICPYQVRYGTDNTTPFLQYIMRKRNDRSHKENIQDHQYNYIDFNKKTFFDHHTTNINLYDEAIKLLKIIMFGYGNIINDFGKIVYRGFRKCENDFYVFFDISDVWINHHYLNMHDPLWLVNMYEIFVLNQVCSVPVSNDIINFFNLNPDLVYLYYPDDTRIKIPVVGFTVEDKKHMDFTMTFGTSQKKYKDIDAFVYYYDYIECCDTISEEEKCDKIVMRHCIFYENNILYDDYMALFDEDKDRHIIVDKINDRYCGFVVGCHNAQTPLTSHNILSVS